MHIFEKIQNLIQSILRAYGFKKFRGFRGVIRRWPIAKLTIEASLQKYFLDNHLMDTDIDKKISQMLILGIGQSKTDWILSQIKLGNLGGIVLYKYHIINPENALGLTNSLKEEFPSHIKPFILLDQEGGEVSRIAEDNGFTDYPSAEEMGTKSLDENYNTYSAMARDLTSIGFNMNLAPCVDINIVEGSFLGLHHRCYGTTADTVKQYAETFVKSHYDNKIIPVLKHFPGLGCTVGDSHEVLPDTTDTWKEEELEPYKHVIEKFPDVPVMVGHTLNKNFDDHNPSSISKPTIDILKDKCNHKGIVITDAIDMAALQGISIEDIVINGINAGVDMFIFPNSVVFGLNYKLFMHPVKFHMIIKKAIHKGIITEEQIDKSYQKIIAIKEKFFN